MWSTYKSTFALIIWHVVCFASTPITLALRYYSYCMFQSTSASFIICLSQCDLGMHIKRSRWVTDHCSFKACTMSYTFPSEFDRTFLFLLIFFIWPKNLFSDNKFVWPRQCRRTGALIWLTVAFLTLKHRNAGRKRMRGVEDRKRGE